MARSRGWWRNEDVFGETMSSLPIRTSHPSHPSHLVRRRRWLLGVIAAIGAGAAAVSSADEPLPKKPEPVELPHFNGKDLKGWRAVDQFVFRRHGKVEVNGAGAVVLGKGDPGTAIVWAGVEPPQNNYEITAEGRRTDGDDFFCGLTFPVDKSHCTLIVGGWGGSVTGLSNVDDMAADENETTNAVEIKPNQWYRIRLRVTPREIQAWFNDKKIVDLDARGKRFSVWWEQEPVRPLGLATWNTAAEIRKFKVIKV